MNRAAASRPLIDVRDGRFRGPNRGLVMREHDIGRGGCRVDRRRRNPRDRSCPCAESPARPDTAAAIAGMLPAGDGAETSRNACRISGLSGSTEQRSPLLATVESDNRRSSLKQREEQGGDDHLILRAPSVRRAFLLRHLDADGLERIRNDRKLPRSHRHSGHLKQIADDVGVVGFAHAARIVVRHRFVDVREEIQYGLSGPAFGERVGRRRNVAAAYRR